MPESVENLEVVPVDPKAVDADVVFSALPADLALKVEPNLQKPGLQ
nr:hypothetical protein [Methanosarcina barkeri]